MNNEYIGHIKRLLKNKYTLFFTVIIIDLLLSVLASFIIERFFPNSLENIGGMDFSSPGEEFFIAVLFAPLFETLLFQALPIYLILKHLKSAVLAIIFSTLLFTLQHNYSWIYMIVVFPSGIIYASYYIYIFKRKGNGFAFLLICSVHAIYNLVAFLMIHTDSLFSN